MLDVYELRGGNFEIVDSQMHELRSRRMLYLRLVRFAIILLGIFAATFLFITYFTSNIFWIFPVIIPIFLIYYAYRSLELLKEKLSPQVASIVLEYDKEKQLQNFKRRTWMQNELDEYLEEEIRYNQAVGFRIIWFENGFLEIEIIVDPNFPGTKVFETYDFLAVAEFTKLMELALPDLDQRQFRYEDGAEWTQDQLEEFQEEEKNVRIPWIARDYFSQL